jgi:hypothetical protein
MAEKWSGENLPELFNEFIKINNVTDYVNVMLGKREKRICHLRCLKTNVHTIFPKIIVLERARRLQSYLTRRPLCTLPKVVFSEDELTSDEQIYLANYVNLEDKFIDEELMKS